MLKTVLSKLIKFMNKRNECWMRGMPNVDSVYVPKCDLLMECLKDVGYKIHIKTEPFEITKGNYRGCRGNIHTEMSFDVPGISTEDVKAFQDAGFEWLWSSNVMIYKFKKNRKEELN